MGSCKCNSTQKKALNLLLSYTYFLDEKNKFFVSVGHSVENFKSQVILSKNSKQKIFEWEEWNAFYQFKDKISSIFEDENVTDTRKENGFELVCINDIKKLIIKCGPRKCFEILKSEWNKFTELSSFINSIACFQNNMSEEVENYYKLYLSKCIEKNSVRLEYDDFFTLSQVDYNAINFSRLFHEIPILCKSKLISDYFQIVCSYLT